MISYKNRDVSRVYSFLDSLENQTLKNFDLIFVDYGSDKPLKNSVDFKKYSYDIEYIYTYTNGHFWNRAASLNIGLKISQSDVIIIADIDLIFSENFIDDIYSINFDNFFYTFNCYYLRQGFSYFDVKKYKFEYFAIGVEKENYVGLCAIKSSDLKSINYFDEFYQIWGLEDDDLYKRLSEKGISRSHISLNKASVFHVWHITDKNRYPSPWHLTMINYYFSNDDFKKNNLSKSKGTIINSNDRILLNAADYVSYQTEKLELYHEPHLVFYKFINTFMNGKSNVIYYFNYNLSTQIAPTFRNIFFKLLNKFKQKATRHKKLTLDLHDPTIIQRFIEFFICTNLEIIKDYYYDINSDRISLRILKK